MPAVSFDEEYQPNDSQCSSVGSAGNTGDEAPHGELQLALLCLPGFGNILYPLVETLTRNLLCFFTEDMKASQLQRVLDSMDHKHFKGLWALSKSSVDKH
jgi:hypothetical protein